MVVAHHPDAEGQSQQPSALVAQWIERVPRKAKVAGSNPAERAILATNALCICTIDGNVRGTVKSVFFASVC